MDILLLARLLKNRLLIKTSMEDIIPKDKKPEPTIEDFKKCLK